VTRWLLALPLLAAPLTRLLGQAPSDRPALDRFHDSLASVHDTSALRRLRHGLTRRSADNPLAILRTAYVSLRLAELGADPAAGDALGELARLTKREPDWPYAWHALALAERRRAVHDRANKLELGSRVGARTLERALDDEGRALAADPGYVAAALTLADLALGLRDTARYAGARDALRRSDAALLRPSARGSAAAPGPGADPGDAPASGSVPASAPAVPAELLLARGRLERASGETDSAVATFARAVASGAAAALASLARLELARTLLGSGARRGASSARAESDYYAAAADDDSIVVAGFRADLSPIATDAELHALDAARGSARAAFLRRFWTDRDRAELRQDGERLREHYRRLLYARRHFALTTTRRYYGGGDAWRSGSEELDDRGLVYVRHGEPATRLRPFVFGLMPNETWRYGRADGDLLLHFSAGYDEAGGGDLYDYRLVESVLDLRGAADAPRDQLLLSRQKLSPVYGRMLNWGQYGAARARGEERGIGAASIEYGTTTDSYELQFARRLTAYADLVAVGSRGGVPLAHFVFAIGPAEITPQPAAGGVSYPVRVRLVALDSAGHAVAHADTALRLTVGRPLSRGQYLLGRVELPLPPGAWSWRAALQQGESAGVVLPRDSVQVSPPGPALALSDLALGFRPASARWLATPADTVLLTPFELFPEGSQVELYYEAGSARPGEAYRHEIGVFRVRGDDRAEERPVVRLRVDERSAGGVIRTHRTLQLARLKPGRYVVEVKLTGPEGQVAARRREIRVVKRER
jgi:GWxTD domain-containing protein